MRNLGAAQDHFVDWVAFDDIDVVEGGFILFVRQHDFVGGVNVGNKLVDVPTSVLVPLQASAA
jgi:hypothetical protein